MIFFVLTWWIINEFEKSRYKLPFKLYLSNCWRCKMAHKIQWIDLMWIIFEILFFNTHPNWPVVVAFLNRLFPSSLLPLFQNELYPNETHCGPIKMIDWLIEQNITATEKGYWSDRFNSCNINDPVNLTKIATELATQRHKDSRPIGSTEKIKSSF